MEQVILLAEQVERVFAQRNAETMAELYSGRIHLSDICMMNPDEMLDAMIANLDFHNPIVNNVGGMYAQNQVSNHNLSGDFTFSRPSRYDDQIKH